MSVCSESACQGPAAHSLKALLAALLVSTGVVAGASDARAEFVGRPISDVIDEFRAQGLPFVYSSSLVPETLVVLAEPRADQPVDIVREILAPHKLTVRRESGVILIVRDQQTASGTGSIVVVVVHEKEERPVETPVINFEPVLSSKARLKAGVYEYANVAAGRYEVTVAAQGLTSKSRVVDVWPGDAKIITFRLDAARPEIETIAVSASRYEIARDIVPSGFVMDQRTIQSLPDIGDDPLRAVQKLPGAAASGASAKTYIRGGDQDEVGIVLNGARLFDPFHVRDYQSVFSAIDSRALDGVEVYTGGFPVRYGNRMSGMILMESLEPVAERHTEIGLSVYNTSVLTAGRDRDRRWLVSARRGNLDLVIDPQFGSPAYYDAFAEYEWDVSANTTLSWNALYASDRVEIILESDPDELERAVSETENAQVWLQVDNEWSDSLSSKTVFSATWFDNLRRGSLDDEEKLVASVFDDRQVSQVGLRQDFSYRRSDRHVIQWGLQIRQGQADYQYRNSAEYFGLQSLFEGRDEALSRNLVASPDGASYAVHFADRWKLGPTTTAEWGLRWDDQTYTGISDSQFSPRVSLLHGLGEQTELRLSWGRYHQAQEINELQIEDGIVNFWPAQRADHMIAGLRHRFADRYSFRLEIFDKSIDDVRPRFENLFNPLGLIPEVQADRVRLDPSGSRSRGIEVSLERNDGPLRWWATYTLSEATDRINGREELRSWDQRNAFVGGVGFSDERWDLGLVASVRSGWPLTELSLVQDGFDDDGEPLLRAVPGSRNAGRYDTFASVDLRIARKWKLSRGALTAFLEVSNLANRRNPCCLDWDLEENDSEVEVLERGVDYWMPLLPAVGVLWEF